jgi:hypothetical protein
MQRIVSNKMVPVIAGLLLLGATAHRASAWGVVWSDEFNGTVGTKPNSGNWQYDTGGGGWGNGEIQIYVNSLANAQIASDGTGTDGKALRIQPQSSNGAWNGQWYSARLNSYGKHMVGPGSYIEFRCKFPNSGQGYWPAAWLLGTVGGSWPYCGEIDVAEEINAQWENHQSLHMPGWDPTVVRTVSNSTTTYHNYGMWWPADGNSITFNMDGANSATWSKGQGGTWEFNTNNRFFLLINCAIGGYWPGNPNSATRVNGNFFVDYVRHYM